MMRKDLIGILAVAGALLFGACEQNPRSGANERGGTTSMPASRGPGGEGSPRAGATGSSGMASGSPAASSNDQSGTGGSGDAGFGGRDGGIR
jgi:hypothetical protein